MEYLLDPYVIQLPTQFDSKDNLIDYLGSISNWSTLFNNDSSRGKYWFSEPALQELWATGHFPGYSQLNDLYNQVEDISDFPFDPGIVSRACEKLNCPPFIDDEIARLCPEVEKIILEEDQSVIIPDEIRSRLEPSVAEALIQTFHKLALIHKHFGILVFENLFFATRALHSLNEMIEIKTHCFHIDTGEFLELEDVWLSVTDPSTLFDVEKNWRDPHKMIDWAYDNLINQGVLNKNVNQRPVESDWSIGDHFFRSIEQYHFNRVCDLIAIYYAVVKLLVKYWPRDYETDENHYLQKGSLQVMRQKDGGLAWRVHVTNSAPKIRLHYWAIGNHIELSCVVPHNNYKML